jgi:hypothetical protein
MDRIHKDVIRDVLEDEKQGLHIDDIALRLVNNSLDLFSGREPLEFEKVKAKANTILLKEANNPAGIFTRVKNPKTKKEKKGTYKLRPNKRPPKPPLPPNPPGDPDPTPKPIHTNLFVGKAGECAVMSELLFRGYNVNSMLVDDGVDIVASKNNMFYYLQVKTTEIKVTPNGRHTISTAIKQKKFDDFIGTQIRYVVVARCKLPDSNVETNMYFIFNNDDIKRFISQGKLNTSANNINIKIEIDPKDHKPYIYDDKREDINFYMNKFVL